MTIEQSISQVPLFPMQTASSRFSKGGPRSWRDAADVNALESGKVTVQSIRQHTRRDPVFTRVLEQVVSGWKSSYEDNFKQLRKDELMGVTVGITSGHSTSIAVQSSCSVTLWVFGNSWRPNMDADIEGLVTAMVTDSS